MDEWCTPSRLTPLANGWDVPISNGSSRTRREINRPVGVDTLVFRKLLALGAHALPIATARRNKEECRYKIESSPEEGNVKM